METMKKIIVASALAAGLLLAPACWAQSQGSQQTPSLGDLARRLREQRPSSQQAGTKVYTNDNLPRQGGLIEGASASESSQAGAESSSKGESATAAGATAKSDEHNEKYYRDTLAELQSTKAMHERELSVLDQKLNLNQTQYYSDPNKTLNQEFSRDDINKKQNEIDEKKKQIDADQKAIDDLRAQCQQEGCPAGWLR
jgi:hypothetical protein